MSVSELLAAGLEVTILGMVTVFVLLGLMIFVVRGMSRLANLVEGEAPSTDQARAAPTVTAAAADQELIAAITAAIHRYRRLHP
jgi:oxaloacetate decarboxylase gamma subunit